MRIKGLRARTVPLVIGLMHFLVPALAAPDQGPLSKAHQLVNDYYGDSRILDEAARIVGEILRVDPDAAGAYVEAARITVKGGHVVSDKFLPGTKDLYRNLINKALSLDPNNVAALGLKAEYLRISGDRAAAFEIIQRGLQLSPKDPWLRVELATHYRHADDAGKAFQIYEELLKGSECESNVDYGRACVDVLLSEIELLNSYPTNVNVVRLLAKRAEALRHPRDAWTLGSLGRYFAEMDLLDDSIDYSRRALKVMDYGIGRRNLAIALYMKAAVLHEQGKPNDSQLQEADKLRVPKDVVLDWFEDTTPAAKAHEAAVRKVLERRTRPKP